MNRRGFLAAIGGLAAAAAAGIKVVPLDPIDEIAPTIADYEARYEAIEFGTYDSIRFIPSRFITRAVVLNGGWLVGVEPEPRRDRPAYRQLLRNRWER